MEIVQSKKFTGKNGSFNVRSEAALHITRFVILYAVEAIAGIHFTEYIFSLYHPLTIVNNITL